MPSSPALDRSTAKFVGIAFAAIGVAAALYQFTQETRHPYLYGLILAAIAATGPFLLFPFVRPRPRTVRQWTLAVVGALAILVLVGGGLWLGHLLKESNVKVARILTVDPPPGRTNQIETVDGQVQGMDPGDTLWVFVAVQDMSHYYLQPGPCIVIESNRWRCDDVVIGRPIEASGAPFYLVVARADSSKTRDFVEIYRDGKSPAEWRREFTALPRGVVVSEPVEVKRR